MKKPLSSKDMGKVPELEPSVEECEDVEAYRFVHLNNPVENSKLKYCSNTIITSRYTMFTFLPKVLFFEFTKLANAYFLVISIMQCIKRISNTDGFPASLPALTFIVMIDMAFIAAEDYRRHVSDRTTNNTRVHRLDADTRGFVDCASSALVVGDIIKIYNREMIPADCIILGCFEPNPDHPNGICYVETKSLDGETNLKLRQGVEGMYSNVRSDADLLKLQGHVECEVPNNSIHRFNGSVTLQSGKQDSVGTNSILLRGCMVRNTEYVYGLVVNTGPDTKIMMASQGSDEVKWSNMELRLNRQILYIVGLMVVLCLTGAAVGTMWNHRNLPTHKNEKAWYLFKGMNDRTLKQPMWNFVLLCLYYFLLLNSFIPVSLYVSMTSVKFMQAYFMNADLKMYHAESDTPCQVRTMALNEELGQINYIFSDKTGTLTCNVMEFRKCAIDGVAYGTGDTEVGLAAKMRQNIEHKSTAAEQKRPVIAPFVNFQDDSIFDATSPKIGLFWEHLAVCHTVMPETASDGSLRLSASSPDEQALVAAAACFGYSFYARSPGEAMLDTPTAKATYKVLDVLEFNSTRKRMSVVVEKPNGSLWLLCKGADTVIYERLKATTDPEVLRVREKTLQHMETFASEGLRTLVIAHAPVDRAMYTTWAAEYKKAANNMCEIEKRRTGEENLIDSLMELMEKDLEVLGATAIEDKLQEGVPDAIAKLREASIKVWMLTGDKEETAINIGFACQLLHLEMELIVISGNNHEDIDEIRETLEKYQQVPMMDASTPTEKALIIDGETLELALLHCPDLLLNVAEQCTAVIACRVSPAQKAELVLLVKDNVDGSITLAIGDGANDVSMIQAAHVGIGISGQEGMQAANSSDYSIAQFRFLKRLLFVHGRWNYVRMSTLILYIFYKNVMMNMTQYCFMIYSGFSGQKYFLEWGLQGYNIIFTALPIVLVGACDQDLPDYLCEAFPKLYSVGQSNRKFNTLVVGQWVMSCIWESTVICLFTVYGLKLDNTSVPMWTLGSCAFTCVILIVNLKLMLNQNLHSLWHAMVYTFSIGMWWVLAVVVSSSTFFFVWRNAFSLIKAASFWLLVPIVIITALTRDVYWKGILRNFYPSYTNLAQEVHCLGWRARAEYLLSYPPPENFHPSHDMCAEGKKTAAAVPVVAATPPPHLSKEDSLETPWSPHDTARPSLRHRNSVRGVAFSYDAESLMAQSFLVTDRTAATVPTGPGLQIQFKRHASIGSIAFQQDHPVYHAMPPRAQTASVSAFFGSFRTKNRRGSSRRLQRRAASFGDAVSSERSSESQHHIVRRYSTNFDGNRRSMTSGGSPFVAADASTGRQRSTTLS
ncbi:Aste57867_24402 [Aphanomyces stellatus]|uniref:Phospholipid-transporting ATPase n=1 Tax=Aphanomyces stellatus TaxID=120398 RepID=A0A485LS81_9STRA|nr:hypothetical protein As57867_024326 [Aphanomyces stellatus]VFU01042.1 Aste57867_24402 [Aphanomyces stellatus]